MRGVRGARHDGAQGDILSCGGVKAMVQCVNDVGNLERVRAAAAGTLSILMVDGAIAVEVRAGAWSSRGRGEAGAWSGGHAVHPHGGRRHCRRGEGGRLGALALHNSPEDHGRGPRHDAPGRRRTIGRRLRGLWSAAHVGNEEGVCCKRSACVRDARACAQAARDDLLVGLVGLLKSQDKQVRSGVGLVGAPHVSGQAGAIWVGQLGLLGCIWGGADWSSSSPTTSGCGSGGRAGCGGCCCSLARVPAGAGATLAASARAASTRRRALERC